MKLIGLLLLVATGCLLGIYASLQLNQRVKVLTLTAELLSFLQTRILYTAQPLGDLIGEAAEQTRFASISLLKTVVRHLEHNPFPTAWEQGVHESATGDGFTRDDRELLLRIGTELGKTDVAGQSSHLILAQREVSDRLEEARLGALTKGKLYRTLGFSLGAATALLLM